MGGKQSGAHVDDNVEVSQLSWGHTAPRRNHTLRGRPKSTMAERAYFKGKWRWDPVKGEFVERET